MAVTTTTCTLAASAVPVIYNAPGTVRLTGRVAAHGATGTLGDTYLLAKIPHGALVLDGWLTDSGPGVHEFSIGLIGTGGSLNDLVATVCASGARQDFALVPVKCSVTDNARDQFRFLALTTNLSASITASGTFVFSVEYSFQQPNTP